MANTCYKRQDSPLQSSRALAEETVGYVWGKARRILPYYLPACLLVTVLMLIKGEWGMMHLIGKIPSLLFLQRTGLSEAAYLSVAWYLSSMLIAMTIVFPICRKHYHLFTMVIAPISALLIIGAIIVNTGTLGDIEAWAVVTYKCNFRAIAEVSLGTTCYEISRRLQGLTLSRRERLMASLAAAFSMSAVLLFVCSSLPEDQGGMAVILLAIVITVAMSRIGYW